MKLSPQIPVADLPDPVRTRGHGAADDRAHPPSRSGRGSPSTSRASRRPAPGCRASRSARRRSPSFRFAGSRARRRSARSLDFASWCRRERIAVVQTCDLYANIFGLPGAALAGVPVRIGSRRELNPDKTAGQIRLQRQAYRCATRVVANSAAARTILEQEGLAGSAIAVIPNGVDARLRIARTAAEGHSRACPPERRAATQVDHRRQPATREEPRDADRRGRAARRRLPRGCSFRSSATVRGARSSKRSSARGGSSAASSFLGHREDVAGAARARPTSSCCPRGRRRFRTAPSKRWRRACRWSRAPSAGCSI